MSGIYWKDYTFCSGNCRREGEVLSALDDLPAGTLDAHIRQVCHGACPSCGKTTNLNLYPSHYVFSALIITQWRSKSLIACRQCGLKSQLLATLSSTLLGWWGVPWGLFVTPMQIFRNIAAISSSRKNVLSPQLRSTLALNLARHLSAGGSVSALSGHTDIAPKQNVEQITEISVPGSATVQPLYFVWANDKEYGPLTFENLKALVNQRLLTKDHWIRLSERDDWIAANSIQHLFEPHATRKTLVKAEPQDRFAGEVEEKQNSSDLASPKHSRPEKARSNFIARHWRGELSLPVSYWLCNFLGAIAAVVAVRLISKSFDFKDEFKPEVALLAVLSIWTVLFVIFLWQTVGTWRSATNYSITNSSKYWGGIAKFFVIIAVLRTLGDYGNVAAPQITEFVNIYNGDKEMGKYEFRVLRDGQELEFSGGITFGAAKELRRFIDAMGSLRVIHLNSHGGRISEAERMAQHIRAKGLNTYAPRLCASACTIVFLSGKERFISDASKIGFHQSSFPGLSSEEKRVSTALDERKLIALGVSAAFARKAYSTPHNDMWYPSANELIAEKVATKAVDSSNFGISGVASEELTDEKIEASLLGLEVYKQLRRIDPTLYSEILSQFKVGFRRGQSLNELTLSIGPKITGLYFSLIPYASDENILRYTRTFIKSAKALNQDNPTACYTFLHPDKGDLNVLAASRRRFKQIVDEENQIQEAIFTQHRGKTRKLPVEQEVKLQLASVIERLSSRSDIDVSLFDTQRVPLSSYSKYCSTLVAMYEEAIRLPAPQAAMLVRYFIQ